MLVHTHASAATARRRDEGGSARTLSISIRWFMRASTWAATADTATASPTGTASLGAERSARTGAGPALAQ